MSLMFAVDVRRLTPIDKRMRAVVSHTDCPGCGRGVTLTELPTGVYHARCYAAPLPNCPWSALMPYEVARGQWMDSIRSVTDWLRSLARQ